MRQRLTILSSFKPLRNDKYSDYQLDALKSWQENDFDVYLFNSLPDLEQCQPKRPYGLVVPESNPPSIKEMLKWYSPDRANAGDGVVAIINSDIRLSEDAPKVLKMAEQMGRNWAATSFRHEFEPDRYNGVVDMGLDFFVMSKAMAARLANDIPDFLTLGRGGWDNYVNGWLRHNLMPQRYFDITDWGIVLHPKHDRQDGRLSGYTKEQTDRFLNDTNIQAGGIPNIKYLKPI